MSPLIISIVVFVAVSALVGAVAVFQRDRSSIRAEDRLEVLTGAKTPTLEKKGILRDATLLEPDLGPAWSERLSEKLGSLLRLFEQADTPLQPNQFFMLTLALAAVGAAAAWWFSAPAGLIPAAAAVLGALPLVFLLYRRRRRLKAFATQLPDALELVARALRAGHSLAAGMHVVSEEMPQPICTEFGRVYEEQNLGIAMDEALSNMVLRMPNLDLKFFVTAVILQRQTGGDLAEILDKIGYVIRERFKIFGQVQALTAEGRLSGVVLMALPVALFFVVYHLNPDYIMMLFTEPMGRQMLTGAIIMQIIGGFVIKKIVNIKV